MKILLALVHYFGGDQAGPWNSTNEKRRGARTAAVAGVVQAWRGHYGQTRTIDIASKSFQRNPAPEDQIDIALVTVPGHSLLDEEFCRRWQVTRVEVTPDNPRMLGFHAHELFARHAAAYDMVCLSEDDLCPSGPDLLRRIRRFAHVHGSERLLVPNRYEWNPATALPKTYIDGDLRAGLVDPMIALHPDREIIEGEADGRPVIFRRARNPHAGFSALTQAQLQHWMRQRHWLDRDTSFISPLESSATLGIVKTFAVYKSWGASLGYAEIQHLDRRFSTMNLPESGGTIGL